MPRFFERGDPAERAQRDLEAKLKGKIDQRVDNAVRLQTAEAKLAECRANVEALALESDEAALDRALQSRRAAEDKLAALHGAAAKIGKEVSEIEAAIDKVVDGRVRVETSAACNAMADRVQKAAAAFDEVAKELEAASKEAGLIIPEAVAVDHFVRSAREQIPPATTMIVGALYAHAKAVLAGGAPASLPRPAAPAPVLTVVPQQEPMQTVFIKRNVKYLDQAGRTVTIAGNRKHSLPQKLAEEALSTNLALPLSDRQLIRDLEYNAPAFFVPDETSCVWLGPPGKEAPPKFMRPGGPPIHSSLTTFEPYDRGPGFSVTVPRGPEPQPMPLAVGARRAEESES
jgi:HAMP domain-containing protein